MEKNASFKKLVSKASPPGDQQNKTSCEHVVKLELRKGEMTVRIYEYE